MNNQTNAGTDAINRHEFEQFKKWQAQQREENRAPNPGEPNGFTQDMLTSIRSLLIPSVAMAAEEVDRPDTRDGEQKLVRYGSELLRAVTAAVLAAVPPDPAIAMRNMTWTEVRAEMAAVFRTLADRLDTASNDRANLNETTTGPTAHTVRVNPYAPSAN